MPVEKIVGFFLFPNLYSNLGVCAFLFEICLSFEFLLNIRFMYLGFYHERKVGYLFLATLGFMAVIYVFEFNFSYLPFLDQFSLEDWIVNECIGSLFFPSSALWTYELACFCLLYCFGLLIG